MKKEDEKRFHDFIRKNIKPLKKGEVLKGKPIERCLFCKRSKWTCKCHKIRSNND